MGRGSQRSESQRSVLQLNPDGIENRGHPFPSPCPIPTTTLPTPHLWSLEPHFNTHRESSKVDEWNRTVCAHHHHASKEPEVHHFVSYMRGVNILRPPFPPSTTDDKVSRMTWRQGRQMMILLLFKTANFFSMLYSLLIYFDTAAS